MLKNMKLGAKIIFGFSVLLLIFLFVASYGTVQLVSIDDNLKILKDRDYQILKNSEQMKMSVVQVQQWLTDSSATGWTDGYDEAETWAKTFSSAFTELINLAPEDSGQLNEIRKSFEAYHAKGIKMADDYVKVSREAGNKQMKEFDAFAEDINDRVDKFKETKFNLFMDRFDTSINAASNARSVNLWLSIIGILVGIILSYLIRNNIVTLMKNLIQNLSEGSDQVSSASSQISSSSQSLASGASQQASSLEETSSSLEEMASQTKQNAENAENANELSIKTSSAAEDGVSAMANMETAMQEINESSGKISKIIKVIEEIAFQTNLLALNAAVEAARAGEAGKGFAVVAEEVRNLAQRSATAAKDTALLIEESVNRADNGGKIVARAAETLNGIVDNVKKMTSLVSQITLASQEQADGVNQVNKAVAEMDRITQQNAANAEETASASEELNSQAEGLQNMVTEMVSVVGAFDESSVHHPVKQRKIQPAILGAPQQHLAAPKPHPGKKPDRGALVNPDEVIPMEDDFKDF